VIWIFKLVVEHILPILLTLDLSLYFIDDV